MTIIVVLKNRNKIKRMRVIDIIKRDLYRYVGERISIYSFIRTVVFVPGFRFTFWLRLSAATRKIILLGRLFWFLQRRMQLKYGFQISDKTKIGDGFYIGHFGTIVIAHEATIGNNCNINHGVTIGGAGRGTPRKSPVIGDFVWLGTNSVIVGGITIGNNVLVAPGAYVNFDVPDNSIVIGNPAKIIPKDNAVDGYIKRVLKNK